MEHELKAWPIEDHAVSLSDDRGGPIDCYTTSYSSGNWRANAIKHSVLPQSIMIILLASGPAAPEGV